MSYFVERFLSKQSNLLVGIPNGGYDLDHHGAQDCKNALQITLVKLFVLLEELNGICEC